MLLIASGWLRVVARMALAADSLGMFLGLALAPVALMSWLAARRARSVRVAREHAHPVDGCDPQPDQQHLLSGGAQLRPSVQPGDEVGDRHIDHAGGNESQ
jgi:hypothetical protein